jgi:hypothetical protein
VKSKESRACDRRPLTSDLRTLPSHLSPSWRRDSEVEDRRGPVRGARDQMESSDLPSLPLSPVTSHLFQLSPTRDAGDEVQLSIVKEQPAPNVRGREVGRMQETTSPLTLQYERGG